jgi:hypothetical protein
MPLLHANAGTLFFVTVFVSALVPPVPSPMGAGDTQGVARLCVGLTTHTHLVSKYRIRGHITPLLHSFSMRGVS